MQTRAIITTLSAQSSLISLSSYKMIARGKSTRVQAYQIKRRSRYIVGQMPDRLLHRLNKLQTFHWTILEELFIRDAEAVRLRWNERVTKLSNPIYLNSHKYPTTNSRKVSRSKWLLTSFPPNHRHLLQLRLRNRMRLRSPLHSKIAKSMSMECPPLYFWVRPEITNKLKQTSLTIHLWGGLRQTVSTIGFIKKRISISRKKDSLTPRRKRKSLRNAHFSQTLFPQDPHKTYLLLSKSWVRLSLPFLHVP